VTEKQFQVFAIIIAILGVIGVELNVQKNSLCFYLWTFSNAGCVYIHYRRRVWAHFFMHIYYMAQAVRGILTW